MRRGLNGTISHLARTANDSAVPLLVAALDAQYEPLRSAALRALVSRGEEAGDQAILAKFDGLTESDIELLRSQHGALGETLQSAIMGSDSRLCEAACKAVLSLRQYEQSAVLIAATEEKPDRQAGCPAATLVQLARLLADEVSGPVTDVTQGDPFFARRETLAALTSSLNRFQSHQRMEIVESFLLLAPHDNSALREILANPFHPCYPQLLQSMRSSPAAGVLRLLVELLKDTGVSNDILELIATRSDTRFLDYLLYHVGSTPALRVLKNMARLEQVKWLQEDRERLLDLDGGQQATAVKLAIHSAIRRSKTMGLLSLLVEKGAPAGRRAACDALVDFPGPRGDELVQLAWHDEDVHVRAAALRQLRRRKLPGAFDISVHNLQATLPELRKAAQESLHDYTVLRYLSEYDEMSTDRRRRDGPIVGMADPGAVESLEYELKSPSPSQRRRAVGLAEEMELVDEAAETLMAMMEEDGEDVAIRCEIARIFRVSQLPKVRRALRAVSQDGPATLREVARSSLASASLEASW